MQVSYRRDEETNVSIGKTKKAVSPTPSCREKMLVESIREQQTNWHNGILLDLGVGQIKRKYKYNVDPVKLKQVFIEARQKEILENKSGSVMVGKLMKKDRILQTKENNKLC